MWRHNISTGLGFSKKAVWSRAARRQQTKSQSYVDAMEEDDEEDMALGFKIRVEGASGGQTGIMVVIKWIKGHDSVLFESFCGMAKRKLEETKN
jgi:23S rRNA (adenine1618-N6)-methyltransferase